MRIVKTFAFLLLAVGVSWATGALLASSARAVDIDPGACIRCEAYGNAETCKRCVDKPDGSKATVPAPCKAAGASPDCKKQLEGECKPLGNPTQFLSCLKEDAKCKGLVEKCEAFK
ncbi:MAG: hypothetical protein U1F33_13805 [Alphaproteobacteria bacterium]